jgi:hypothetical protein
MINDNHSIFNLKIVSTFVQNRNRDKVPPNRRYKSIPFRSKKCLEAKRSFAVLIYSTSTFTLFPMFSFNSPLLNFLVLCNFCKEFVTLIFAPISNHQVSEGTSTMLDSKHTNIKVYLSSLTKAYVSCNLPSCTHTNDKSYIFL